MTETPSHEVEVEEIATDLRRERWLVGQAAIAIAAVVAIVVVRELLLR